MASITPYTVPLYQCVRCKTLPKVAAEFRTASRDRLMCVASCGGQAVEVGERVAEYVSVAMYRTDRDFGGKEEGGWYYTTGHRLDATIRNFAAGEFPQARAYLARLNNEADAHNEARGRKFQSDRRRALVTIEAIAPERFPERPPTYEQRDSAQ